MHPKLTVDRLRRRGLVYVRQSSPGQVVHNQGIRAAQNAIEAVTYAPMVAFRVAPKAAPRTIARTSDVPNSHSSADGNWDVELPLLPNDG